MRNLAIALLSAAALAACGSSASNTSSSGSAATAAPSTSSSSAAPTTAAPGLAIATAAVTGVGTVLVDTGGHTLYRFTPDAAGQTACTGACATNWPPTVLPPGEQVQPAASLSGKFATMARPDGSTQVTYNGWPLYAFAGDSAAGTANGQGKLGKWFAVTPDVAPPTAASPTM
jgi:predicted lipoprotein with Yx(FWY)xxD motif